MLIGPYFIDTEIWRGTHSTVYLARDSRDGTVVALKALYPTPDCDAAAQRRNAQFEAGRLRELSHPNIVSLRESGEADGVPYLSFPFISGRGLDSAFEPGKAAQKPLLEAVVKTCRALDFAHRKGLVHRDLKPRNILIDDKGEPHVLDWGLSWRKGDRTERGVQKIVGTLAYMSPEQARGEETRLSPASDVYSVGAILYHLFTGRPPFESPSTWKSLQMTMGMAPQPPSRVSSTIDTRVERVILCCLEKDPGERYAGAEALAGELERILAGKKPRGPTSFLGRLFGQ